MAYVPPSVLVFQQFVSQSPVITPPDLDTLLIGPAYQIVDKEPVPAVSYDPVAGNVFPYPGLNLGAKIDIANHLDIYFMDVVAIISPESLSGSVQAGTNVIEDTSATFLTNNVQKEDIVLITNHAGVETKHFVDVVLSETQARIFGVVNFSTNEITNTVADPYAIVTGSNDALSIKVDGGAAQSITLPANAAATANDIMTAINGTLTGATASVYSGNKVKIVSASANGSIEFVTVANSAYVTLGFTVGSSLAKYRVVNDRKDYTEVKIVNPNVDPVNSDFGATVTQITLDPGISVTSSTGNVYPIESVGSVLITYRALETRFSGEIIDIESLDEIQGFVGEIDVRNPLAVGASLAVQNTISRIRLFAIDEDNTQGYQEVLDRIEDTDEVYCIVPLTQSPTVAASVRAHINNMSVPERGKWRIMAWSPELVKEKDVQQLSSSGDIEYNNATGKLSITDNANGTFISSNIVPGDWVRVADNDEFGNPQPHAGVYLVTGVDSEQEIVLENMLYTGVAGSAEYTPVNPFTVSFLDISGLYTVFRVLDKTGQAEAMGAIASSFADRRVVQVLPDKVTITLSDGDHIVGGQYACAAIGGMVAGSPPHQGFTNLGITGITKLFNSNKFFNETQLNKMAEEGVYIIVQEVVGALPFTRHQKTTDNLTLEAQELSIVKTVDFVSYFVKRRLRRVIGTYNITAGTIALISNISNAIVAFLIEQTLPRIGAPLLPDSQVLSVAQDPTFKDQVNVAMDIQPPFPVNRIRVDLLI